MELQKPALLIDSYHIFEQSQKLKTTHFCDGNENVSFVHF